MNVTYPQKLAEWRRAIQDGIGLSSTRGQKAYRAGDFPYEQLEQWIRKHIPGPNTPELQAFWRNIPVFILIEAAALGN
jgi:hypothetical protein